MTKILQKHSKFKQKHDFCLNEAVFIHHHKKTPFHYSHSKDFPLFCEPQIISPLLQKATLLLGFKTKGQGQAGREEGGDTGQKEKKGNTQKETQ